MMFVKKSIRYVLAALTVVKSTLAIKYGDLDGEGHPHVGLMVALDINKNPLWRCTGTLISPTLFLTAGHCVDQPAASVTIWFDADNEIGMPQNGYPFKGEASSKSIHAHPEYNTDAFFLHDLGMVKLTKPVKRDYYGELPASGMLDELVSSYRDEGVSFTAVGYGLQFVGPLFLEANKIRYVAQPDLVQINTPAFTGDWSILVTNNANTGGTCFGDSGGPLFLEDTNLIVGVTSYGINRNCASTGGSYRIDTVDDLEWINSFLSIVALE